MPRKVGNDDLFANVPGWAWALIGWATAAGRRERTANKAFKLARKIGELDYALGVSSIRNPFYAGTCMRACWYEGWLRASREDHKRWSEI